MAYTCDLRDVSTDNSDVGWSELNGHTSGSAATLDADYYIQGTNCITQALGTKTGTVFGLEYDNGSAVTFNTGELFFFWQVLLAGNAIGDWASGATGFGMQLGIGSSSGNINFWKSQGANVGRNPYGGWNNIAIDPTFTPDNTEGSPTAGTYQVFGSMPNMVSAVTKGNVHGVDQIRVGRGKYDITGTGNTFTGLAADNDSQTNRYGLFQAVSGGYLWKGLLSFGTAASSCTFTDANKNIIIDNCPRTNSSFNRIEIRNTGTSVSWDSISISAPPSSEVFPGEGSILARGQFEVIDAATVSIVGCTFTDMDTFIFLTGSSIDSTTFRRCNRITTGGGVFDGCLIANSTDTVSIVSSTTGGVVNSSLTSDGSNIGIDYGTLADGTTISWSNELTGYDTGTAGTNVGITTSSGNEAIQVNSTGTITVNVQAGATVPSVYITGGGQVDVVSNFTLTLTDVPSGTDVTIVNTATRAELFHTTSTGTDITYVHAGGETVDIMFVSLSYDPTLGNQYALTLPSSDSSIKVSLINEVNYSNP